MSWFGSLTRLALLLALAYLGFYVYGLIMGVFSPVELLGFTILAVVFAAAFIIHMIRLRHVMKTPGAHEELMRQAHVYRERRGF
jgi:TRAP-type C4-dicarboxylate transport system permease large subunit